MWIVCVDTGRGKRAKMAGPEYDKSDKRLTLIQSKLRSYPDFPKKGILFYDLFSVLGDAEGLAAVVSVIKVEGELTFVMLCENLNTV